MPPKKTRGRKKAVKRSAKRATKKEEFVDTRDLDKFFIKKKAFTSASLLKSLIFFLILCLCFFNIKIREAREIAAESRMVAWQTQK